MKKKRRHKCLHCRELFRPDPRNRHHQRYCSKPECRRASKAASQRRWLGKAANRDYFHGPAHLERVRRWRAAHPGYWRERGPRRHALQEDSLAQPVDQQGKSGSLTETPLQELCTGEPLVLMGLIAHLTGAALQEDIARTTRGLRQLAQDILSAGAEREPAR
ncbi:MAG: hypothetical protein GWN84_06810 [Gammaproteobacteria bacterium]|nr:hypothetical protein [Gammaproteobacteria bacterium]NIR82611.1 hypothetical protein [Gammaproteobacteria bacterium]NIR88970.1 hypothetical protein [Gammaproteobacteria bacterium]NIU03743.1 hypothetical protein [Gammaproteobacteria bacterium]NIV74173.1 hypothetical protein [Gammaproteobacteria bacterium]